MHYRTQKDLKRDFPAEVASATANGYLDLSGQKDIESLPERMNLEALNVSGCSNLRSIPSSLQAKHLIARDCPELEFIGGGIKLDDAWFGKCPKLTNLPQSFRVNVSLTIWECPVENLPDGLDLTTDLTIGNNAAIRSLPSNLSAKKVSITDCPIFEVVPSETRVGRLSIVRSNAFRALPENLDCPAGLTIAGCNNFTSLPNKLTVGQRFYLNCDNVRLEETAGLNVDTLEISGCPLIKTLPEDLVVKGSIIAERSHVEGISWEVWDKNDGKIILPYTCELPSPPSADCGPSL